MKATKFVSIIAILAFASDSSRDEVSLHVFKTNTLQNACEYLWLVITIFQYIDPSKYIHSVSNDYFTVIVYKNQTEYLVYGKHEEWEGFFKKDLNIDPQSFKIMLN